MTEAQSPLVSVIGASGFIGRAVVDALQQRGARVRAVTAPRMSTSARTKDEVLAAVAETDAISAVQRLRVELKGCTAVVNAAGLAAATGNGDELFGANALLPAIVIRALPAGTRLLHISSVAVQGRKRRLDESTSHEPFSPYSLSKALGERIVEGTGTCFRPTSVHGADRPVTQTLVRLCSSRLASVAGRGTRPTPQVLVENVADAIAVTTLWDGRLPPVVLQPSESLTTAELVHLLGDREPLHVPGALAVAILTVAWFFGRWSSGLSGTARRLEMLWMGQEQEQGWLSDKWQPPYGRDQWLRLRR